MGPSGTGKTTILNTIQFYVPDVIIYSINTISNFVLDGIGKYHKIIFVDNVETLIRDNVSGLSLLIQLLDRGSRFTIDVKHRNKVYFDPGPFIIVLALNTNAVCDK